MHKAARQESGSENGRVLRANEPRMWHCPQESTSPEEGEFSQ